MDALSVQQREQARKLIESRSHRLPWAGCWIWDGATMPKGYGQIRIHGKAWLAHRLAYCAYVGGPEPKCVMHTCDTPGCVNPAHLEGGTQAANMRDMADKGRNKVPRNRPRFEHGYKTKGGRVRKPLPITQTDVDAIVKRVSDGESQRSVAAHYGIKQQQISSILLGKHWQFKGAQ